MDLYSGAICQNIINLDWCWCRQLLCAIVDKQLQNAASWSILCTRMIYCFQAVRRYRCCLAVA